MCLFPEFFVSPFEQIIAERWRYSSRWYNTFGIFTWCYEGYGNIGQVATGICKAERANILFCWIVHSNRIPWLFMLSHQFSSTGQSTRILCTSTGQSSSRYLKNLSNWWSSRRTRWSYWFSVEVMYNSEDHLHGVLPDDCPVPACYL